MLNLIQPLGDATAETLKRLIEMHEFIALSIVNARQLVAREVPR